MKIWFPLGAALSCGVALLCGNVGSIAADGPAKWKIAVLTSGPIHEAFAQPPDRSLLPLPILKAPPRPLKEEVPDERPDVANVQWIAGYWFYAADRSDYIWVTGVWRVPPPDRQWVSGYWHKHVEIWMRVPGFWAAVTPGNENQEIVYLPKPPPPRVENPGPPPGGKVWAPGSWRYESNSYTWSSGQWVSSQAGWSWTAPGYSWSPGGYAYTDGYWDYSLDRRGFAFAPVHVPAALRTGPFRPNQVVPPAAILRALSLKDNRSFAITRAALVRLDKLGAKRVRLTAAQRNNLAALAKKLDQVAVLRHKQEINNPKPPKGIVRSKLTLPHPKPNRDKRFFPPPRPGREIVKKDPTPGGQKPGEKQPGARPGKNPRNPGGVNRRGPGAGKPPAKKPAPKPPAAKKPKKGPTKPAAKKPAPKKKPAAKKPAPKKKKPAAKKTAKKKHAAKKPAKKKPRKKPAKKGRKKGGKKKR